MRVGIDLGQGQYRPDHTAVAGEDGSEHDDPEYPVFGDFDHHLLGPTKITASVGANTRHRERPDGAVRESASGRETGAVLVLGATLTDL